MKTVDYLDRWLAAGTITAAQHTAISGIVRKQRMSVFVELTALLYFGVLAFAGGLAWTARVYADRWGDAVIVGASVGLAFLLLDLRDEIPIGTALGTMGAVSLAAADALIARFRLYRHGVEEVLSVSGAVLLGVAAVVIGFGIAGTQNADACIAAGLVVSALASTAIYLRCGFQYAGVGAVALA